MTDTTQTAHTLPFIGAGPSFEGQRIWLPQLVIEASQRGSSIIDGMTFSKCRLEGPAVLLALEGCNFDGCNMGYTGGDIRNLLMKPIAPERVIGAIPFQNCNFIGCDFFAVGFTGNDRFLEAFITVLGNTSPEAPAGGGTRAS